MEDICVIKNKDELEGSCYLEVMVGAYNKHCWNEGSLYFSEESFGFLEPTIEKFVPKYDHYAFTEIDRKAWLQIAEDLDAFIPRLASATSILDIENHVGFFFKSTKEQFIMNFSGSKHALLRLIQEFTLWIREKINEFDTITILGI